MTSVFGYSLAIIFMLVNVVLSQDIAQFFSNCKTRSPNFEECLKRAMNNLNPLFKYGN